MYICFGECYSNVAKRVKEMGKISLATLSKVKAFTAFVFTTALCRDLL